MKDDRDLYNNKFYIISNCVTNFFITNVLFLIFISPLLLYIYIFEGNSIVWLLILSMMIGPALATLFSVMGKFVREKEISAIKDFFHFYKINLFQGLAVSIILNSLIVVLYHDIVYLGVLHQKTLTYILIFLLTIIILLGIYIYPIMSRYNVKIVYLFRISIELAIKKFYITLTSLSVIIIAIWALMEVQVLILGPLFGASFICYIISYLERKPIDELEERIKKKYESNV